MHAMFDQLKQMKQLASLMSQLGSPEKLRELREQADRVQQELAQERITAEAGGGAVRVTVNGKLEVLAVKLDRPVIAVLMADTEGDEVARTDEAMVEELIAQAVNDAMARAQAMARDRVASMAGGLDLPAGLM